MKAKVIRQYVIQDDAISIIDQYLNKKLKIKNYTVQEIKEVYSLHHIFDNTISIKRGFKLKPRIIKHLYWVDAIKGRIIRLKDELEDIVDNENGKEKYKLLQSNYTTEECKEICKESAFKHATRYYKSFWEPKIDIQQKEILYIPNWYMVIKDEANEKIMRIMVNAFSGQISTVEEENVVFNTFKN